MGDATGLERGVRAATLVPHRWTPLPDTSTIIRWDGDEVVVVHRQPGGFWNLAHLTRPGQVLLWACLADRPELGVWPIAPVARRATYGTPGRT